MPTRTGAHLPFAHCASDATIASTAMAPDTSVLDPRTKTHKGKDAMWECKVCKKQVEDDEDGCYHCGSPKGIQADVVVQARNVEIAKIKGEQAQLPENFDKNFELDYSTYKRDLFHVFNRVSFKIALLVYIGPFFGLFVMYLYLIKRRLNLENIIYGLVGLIILAVSLYALNALTKVYPVKRKSQV